LIPLSELRAHVYIRPWQVPIVLLKVLILRDPHLLEPILSHHLLLDVLIYQAADPIIVFLALPLDPLGYIGDLPQHTVISWRLLVNQVSQRCKFGNWVRNGL